MSWKFSSSPRHVAIIMDGNGRWALNKGLPRISGHKVGAENIEGVVCAAKKFGIKFLTLYAFSEENWKRPSPEVKSLMGLAHAFLINMKDKMIEEDVCFSSIGDRNNLPALLQKTIDDVEIATRHGKALHLLVALSYGARQEIVRAVNKLLAKGKKYVDENSLVRQLDTKGIPDPDLLIRTGGENRVSNFLLWQIAYAELYFTNVLWPDFGTAELRKAIVEYGKRERRFGGI